MTHRRRPHPVVVRSVVASLVGALIAVGLLGPGSALGAKPAGLGAEPAGFEHFHTYAEVRQVIDAAVADHPAIARRFSMGQSYEGREIWGIKISDNVALDENEPEVFINGLIHARERLSNELALYVIGLLTDGYGTDQQITRIVDNRELWIVPMVNPDGAEYDMSGGVFHQWRKNRQPIPGSSEIGIDLNRQFGFTWNCCGGSSGNPASDNYRGPSAWYAPEVRAYRDFVDGRVVDGRQQIRAIISLHTAGRQVLWPYAYTRTNVPGTMTNDDWRAFVALGEQLAALNGYTPEQGSDLYIVDGDMDDWAYRKHRIFAYTFELAAGASKRYYPTAAEVAAELANNREAVLLFMEESDCPYRAAGLEATNCGPLYDDFEAKRGWSVNPTGTDTATDGGWQRGVPVGTSNRNGVKQRSVVPSGMADLVTGRAGGKVNADDVDGGLTSVRSPQFKLGSPASTGWKLTFRYTFAHNAKATAADYLRFSVNGTQVFKQAGFAGNRNAVWTPVTLSLDAFAGQTVRLLVEAADAGADSLVEAAIDDVRVYRAP